MPVRVEGLGENMAENTVELNQPHQWDVYPLAKLLPCRLLLAIPVSQTEKPVLCKLPCLSLVLPLPIMSQNQNAEVRTRQEEETTCIKVRRQ